MAVDGAHVAVRKNLFNWVAVMHTQTSHTFNVAWQSCDMDTIAPLNMNAPNSILLGALPLVQGRTLLEAYLSYQRPRSAPTQWYPFDPSALDTIVRISGQQGNALAGTCEPRSLLQAAWEVTWRALADSKSPLIDSAYVEHVLTGKPLPASVSTADDEAEVTPDERSLNGSITCTCPCHQDEDTAAFDVIELTAGTDQQAKPRIIGYRCALCNMPLTSMPVAAPA
jgi:hypothetical protein